MHFTNVLVILLSSLALDITAHPSAPTSDISSQPLVQPRSEAGPHEAMIYARAAKSKGKSSTSDGNSTDTTTSAAKSKGKSSTSNGNSTDTTTSSASGPVIIGGYAPLVLGMGMVAALGLSVF